MAVTTYTVKRGDTLWDIAQTYASSISGNTIQARINTLVNLNGIKNPDLIIVGQVLTLSSSSGSGSSSSGSSASSQPTAVTMNLFGLQADDDSGRAMYVTWSWSRSNTAHYKVRWRYYADGVWWIGTETTTTSYESAYCQSTYSAPANAKKVRVAVQPISKTYKDSDGDEHNYWTVGYGTEKEYDFANNPPSVPSSTINVEIKDLVLTASIDNIDASKLNATAIEFEIVKNNTSKFNTGKANINTSTNFVSYSCDVTVGGDYKVRCRAVRGSLVSAWTDYTSNAGTPPAAPASITTCKANSYSNNEITVYLEWTEVKTAETYNIEYTNNKNYFGSSDGTTTKTGIKFTNFEITSLTLGKEYFFRVQAVNGDGESEWSDIKSIVVGTKPVAPTTWSSTTTVITGEPLTLYWVHNAEDGSSQTYAEVEIIVDGSTETYTVQNSTDEDEKDKTSTYILDTTGFTVGAKIQWRVRTAGITKVYGDWSIQRTVDIYAQPTLELGVTDINGELIETLSAFPFYISALAGPNTQSPIGYQVKITANEFYETIDDVGNTKTINKGDAVYSKYFDITDQLLIEMSASNVDLESGIRYTISCTVTMNSGLKKEMTHEFVVSWTDVEYNLGAEITIDEETLTASINPFGRDENGLLVEDLTLAVYRREYDGSFTEIAKGITNSNNTSVTDPHPALNYARYRIVAKTNSTGAISFYDAPSHFVGATSVIIQWDEDWSTFDTNDEYAIERPSWSGSMLKLPYNIDVSDNFRPDSVLISYAGRKHPVSYYGTQLGITSTWNVVIPKYDTETLYALRRLSIWRGDVYVREPSGSGYWASVNVSFSQKHCDVTIPITLDITRVEGGV